MVVVPQSGIIEVQLDGLLQGFDRLFAASGSKPSGHLVVVLYLTLPRSAPLKLALLMLAPLMSAPRMLAPLKSVPGQIGAGQIGVHKV